LKLTKTEPFGHAKGRKFFMVTIEIFSDNSSVKEKFQCEAAENIVAHND